MRQPNRGKQRGGRGRAGFRGRGRGPGGKCVCTNPDCEHEITHKPGKPCYQQKCPKCGSPMIRKQKNISNGSNNQ
jgi:hypothetical protein